MINNSYMFSKRIFNCCIIASNMTFLPFRFLMWSYTLYHTAYPIKFKTTLQQHLQSIFLILYTEDVSTHNPVERE